MTFRSQLDSHTLAVARKLVPIFLLFIVACRFVGGLPKDGPGSGASDSAVAAVRADSGRALVPADSVRKPPDPYPGMAPVSRRLLARLDSTLNPLAVELTALRATLQKQGSDRARDSIVLARSATWGDDAKDSAEMLISSREFAQEFGDEPPEDTGRNAIPTFASLTRRILARHGLALQSDEDITFLVSSLGSLVDSLGGISPEMREFLVARHRQESIGVSSDAGLRVSPDSLAARVLAWESFAQRNPKSVMVAEARDEAALWLRLLFEGDANTPSFQDDNTPDDACLAGWKAIASSPESSRSRKLAKEWLGILSRSRNHWTSECRRWYEDHGYTVPSRVDESSGDP